MLTRDQPSTETASPEGLKPRILNAAREAYFSCGIAGVSARKIAERLGCSATAIYLHYDGIGDVLHHLRMEGHALLGRALGESPVELAPLERLIDMQERYFRFGTENPDYFRLMFPADLSEAPLTGSAHDEAFSLEVVKACAQQGIDNGTIGLGLDATVVANLLWMQVHGLTAATVAGHTEATAAGRTEDLLAALLQGSRRWLRT